MYLLALLGLATAEEPEEPIDYAEVVLVWPDKFARWRDTRWFVGMELLYPVGLVLSAEEDASFRTIALQTKAVIACDQEHKLGGRRLEVGCTIEDITVQATSVNRFKTKRGKEIVQRVLDDIDTSLTGAKVQLQTNERGSIMNIGLDGVSDDNTRERLRAETLRQVLARLFYPFHMKLPKSGVREGQWVEYDSDLMTMPSATASRGSSMIVHYMNFYKGYLLVQDIGAGQVQVDRPPQAAWIDEEIDTTAADAASSEDGDSAAFDQILPNNVFDVPIGYKLHLDGVSIYNVDNGVMEERVWSMTGRPNAQNPGNLKLWYSGKIALLGDDDKPDLGKTQQISYPGLQIPGLPAWTSVDPQMAESLDVPPPRTRPASNKK